MTIKKRENGLTNVSLQRLDSPLVFPAFLHTADGHLLSPSALRDTRAIMASSSPQVDQYGNISGGSGYGSNNSESGKSPLNLSLGFLKTLTEKKGTRGTGSYLRSSLRSKC